MLKRVFTEDGISIKAILHAENKGKLYTGPKLEKDDREDPLDTLSHVCAAFPHGVWSFERINNRVCIRGLKKGPWTLFFSMPPYLPIVSLVRSYVRAVRMPQSGWGLDGGRIANLALDEPDCHSAG